MDRITRSMARIGRIGFDVVELDQAVTGIIELASTCKGAYVVTPNVDHVVRAEQDPVFEKICGEADMVLADGMPIVWASRWLAPRLPMRVAGSDLAPAVCAEAARRGLKVFLLGGLPGEAELAAEKLRAKHPTLKVAGCYSPPFGFEHDAAECRRIISMVNAESPDIVLVGVGSPKQEKWIYRWRRELSCGVLIAVGATIGFMAGTLRRAPRFMQVTGTEWLFRLCQEPRRLFGRYARDVNFLPILWRSWRQSRVVWAAMPRP